MATRFKKGRTWYVRHKTESGAWINICCGRSATAEEAETIRKNYDARELNYRHHAAIRPVAADLLQQLEQYKKNEIPRSNTGLPKSRKSITRYQACIDNFTIWMSNTGIHHYKAFTESKAREFFDYLLSKNRSASTIAKHRETLIKFFKWSIANHYVDLNPMLAIKAPKRVPKPPRFFSEAELKKIFDNSLPPYGDIFKFLYLTGLRIGELGNAETSHYQPHLQALRIPVMEGNKTKRETTLPLNPEAIKIIERQEVYRQRFNSPDAGKYIFLNALGLKLDNGNIYENLKRVLHNQKIPDASPHTFRHTTASHLVIKGVSLYVVRDVLRHASIRETELYAHLSKEPVREAIKLLHVN